MSSEKENCSFFDKKIWTELYADNYLRIVIANLRKTVLFQEPKAFFAVILCIICQCYTEQHNTTMLSTSPSLSSLNLWTTINATAMTTQVNKTSSTGNKKIIWSTLPVSSHACYIFFGQDLPTWPQNHMNVSTVHSREYFFSKDWY